MKILDEKICCPTGFSGIEQVQCFEGQGYKTDDYGYYVDGYIVGNFEEVNDEYINFDYWISVDTNTLEIFSDYVDGQEIWIKFNLGEK